MNKENREVIITKLILYIIFVIASLTCFIVLPKSLLTYDELYFTANSLADIDEEVLVLYDYKVYSTDSKFEIGLEEDVPKYFEEFKSNGNVLLVKIHGDKKTLENKGDYWIMHDDEAIELNIEYYIVPNVKFDDYVLPTKTVIKFIENMSKKVNLIYLVSITLLLIAINIPSTIGIVKASIKLKKKNEE